MGTTWQPFEPEKLEKAGAGRGKNPDTRTAGQRWRRRRNVLIVFAHKHGFRQRYLAEVFDLAQSQVSAIIQTTTAEGSRR